MLGLRDANMDIAPVTVKRWLTDRRMDVGVDDSWLISLEFACPSATQVPAAATTVREKAISRQLIISGNKIANLGYDQSTPLAKRKDAAEALLMQIGEERQSKDIYASDIANKFKSGFFAEMQQTKSFSRVPTHIGALDAQLVGGFGRKELSIICARPSMGKSLTGLALSKNIALEGGGGVLYLSLEMGKEAIFRRLLASQTGIDSKILQQPWLLKHQPEIIKGIERELDLLRTIPMTVYDDPDQSIATIRSRSRREAARLQREGRSFDAIVIDHLGLISEIAEANASANSSAVIGVTGAVTTGLCNLAKELNVPVIALAQLTRAAAHRNDKRPTLVDLRGSGRIEEDADVVLGLHRPEYYDQSDPNVKGILEIVGLKGRDTGTSTSIHGIDLATGRLAPCPANDYRC
jgi:replicative DNA helicase